LEEGKKVKDDLVKTKKLLHEIKDNKLNHLKDNEIPEKYHYDLKKKKLEIWKNLWIMIKLSKEFDSQHICDFYKRLIK